MKKSGAAQASKQIPLAIAAAPWHHAEWRSSSGAPKTAADRTAAATARIGGHNRRGSL
jgi:hypothetical protein